MATARERRRARLLQNSEDRMKSIMDGSPVPKAPDPEPPSLQSSSSPKETPPQKQPSPQEPPSIRESSEPPSPSPSSSSSSSPLSSSEKSAPSPLPEQPFLFEKKENKDTTKNNKILGTIKTAITFLEQIFFFTILGWCFLLIVMFDENENEGKCETYNSIQNGVIAYSSFWIFLQIMTLFSSKQDLTLVRVALTIRDFFRRLAFFVFVIVISESAFLPLRENFLLQMEDKIDL